MINYAHRGASEYAPENTLSSFYLGLLQGANGIETDVQRTKDGALVLFHDDTLERVSNGCGLLSDHTLEQLRQLQICGNAPVGFYDRIVTLRQFLEKFAHYDISFAVELKGPDVGEETLTAIREFGILEKTTFTSFHFDRIRKIKELDARVRVGYLTSDPDRAIGDLLSIGGEEIAPKAEKIELEDVVRWRALGLGVRAWGVHNEELMKKMCDLDVDGMTVNFPDKLKRYLDGGEAAAKEGERKLWL